MSINYGSAYRAFRREQEKLREQYRQLGMTDEQIAAMYEFDFREFKGDCVYRYHILISTSSIALQNAVLKEYIPFLSKLMLSDSMTDQPIRAVIRKGKQHYVCDRRLDNRLRQIDMNKKNKAAANALTSLLADFDLDHAKRLSSFDRERVCVPRTCDCGRSTCRYFAFLQECESQEYLFQICNHNLLLADAMRHEARTKPLLPASCAIVIDEAHKLPETARQMLGKTLRAGDITQLAKGLKAAGCGAEADGLKSLSKRLRETLNKSPEERPFSDYERMLIAPERVLGVIKKNESKLPRSVQRKLNDMSTTVSLLCGADENTLRYAVETEDGGTLLCAAAPDVEDRLRAMLWNRNTPILLTSGTLAVGSDFRRFRQETGIPTSYRVRESVSPSPFDYQRNTLLYFPKRPAFFESKDYYLRLAEEIRRLLNATHGHALILFTSYAAMFSVKERLIGMGCRWKLQSAARSGAYTMEQFRQSPGAVLLATGSAWEGMDFPGDCVSLLIIPRLPFPQPDAVREKERQSFDTLREFIDTVVVPKMQIKLRQGFGRAIRTDTDTCVVAILDERASLGKRYYHDVIQALPSMRQTCDITEVDWFIRSVKSPGYFRHVPAMKKEA